LANLTSKLISYYIAFVTYRHTNYFIIPDTANMNL